MKKALTLSNLAAFLVCSIFLYFLWRPSNPINPVRLKETFVLCEPSNVSSWTSTPRGPLVKIQFTKPFFVFPEGVLEFSFDKPQPPPISISCKTFAPIDDILRAEKVRATISANQKVAVKTGFYRGSGQGPVWGPVSLQGNLDLFEEVEHELDQPNQKKLNWLVSPYEAVTLIIDNYSQEAKLVIRVLAVSMR